MTSHRSPRFGGAAGRAVRFALLPLLAALAGGCRDGMSGTYQAQDGSRDTIEFKGSRAYVTFNPAPTMVGEYALDDDKVILTINGSGGQSIALTRKGDTLEGAPFGKTFIKK